MEKIAIRYQALVNAVTSLEAAIIDLHEIKKLNDNKKYKTYRDSVIQRFEYSIDMLWKYLKLYIVNVEKSPINVSSPRAVIKEAVAIGIISSEDKLILDSCVEDRNLTSHTYVEVLAEDISSKIPDYCNLMKRMLEKLVVH